MKLTTTTDFGGGGRGGKKNLPKESTEQVKT